VGWEDDPPGRRLGALGWDDGFAALLASEAPGLDPGRVVAEDRGQCVVVGAAGEIPASPSGRLRHAADVDPATLWPTVGDWVAMAGALEQPAHQLIQTVLPRRTALVRRAPGERRLPSQVLATNVDTVFVVTSVNADFNIRRLERYVAVAWDSGAQPVILLSKADLADDLTPFRAAAQAIAPTVDVLAISVVTGEGLEAVRRCFGPGQTVVFIGSSGVGKSSIVNALAGAPLMPAASIREDDARGRHTTTRRQLVRLADGLLIDTPGLRELGVLEAGGVSAAFEDVERAATRCRFQDCRHHSEPGCGVRAAIADGTLDHARLDAWQKLQREAQHASLATDAFARRAERKRWASVQRRYKEHVRQKYGGG
jgi:ribosome biogenesis GTPase